MSTYVTRVIEVKLPDIQGEVWKEEKLQDIEVFQDHMVYKVNSDRDFPYRVWISDEDSDGDTESKVGHWEKSKECTWSWPVASTLTFLFFAATVFFAIL